MGTGCWTNVIGAGLITQACVSTLARAISSPGTFLQIQRLLVFMTVVSTLRNLRKAQYRLHELADSRSALFAEGDYIAASGWAGVIATHTGQYLDCPATDNKISFNGIDIWVRRGNVFVENWVFVDMIDLFRQFDIDLFERLHR